jgi:hypothetical protein
MVLRVFSCCDVSQSLSYKGHINQENYIYDSHSGIDRVRFGKSQKLVRETIGNDQFYRLPRSLIAWRPWTYLDLPLRF